MYEQQRDKQTSAATLPRRMANPDPLRDALAAHLTQAISQTGHEVDLHVQVLRESQARLEARIAQLEESLGRIGEAAAEDTSMGALQTEVREKGALLRQLEQRLQAVSKTLTDARSRMEACGERLAQHGFADEDDDIDALLGGYYAGDADDSDDNDEMPSLPFAGSGLSAAPAGTL